MSNLMSPSYCEHVMLLYSSDIERNATADPHCRAQHRHAKALPAEPGFARAVGGDRRAAASAWNPSLTAGTRSLIS